MKYLIFTSGDVRETDEDGVVRLAIQKCPRQRYERVTFSLPQSIERLRAVGIHVQAIRVGD